MLILFHIVLLSCISSIFCKFHQLKTHKKGHDLIWCNRCSARVGEPSDLFYKESSSALEVDYMNVFNKNVTVQTLMNPRHFMFDVITTKKASCMDRGRNIRGDSWFPGYTWRVCTCPNCSSQLGWTFEKALSNDIYDLNQNETFHALILNHTMGGVFGDAGIGIMLPSPTTLEELSTTHQSLSTSTLTKGMSTAPLTTASVLYHQKAHEFEEISNTTKSTFINNTSAPTTPIPTGISLNSTSLPAIQIPKVIFKYNISLPTTPIPKGISLNNTPTSTTPISKGISPSNTSPHATPVSTNNTKSLILTSTTNPTDISLNNATTQSAVNVSKSTTTKLLLLS